MLQHSTGFGVVGRYRDLLTAAQDAGFAGEARWLSTQLRHIQDEPHPSG